MRNDCSLAMLRAPGIRRWMPPFVELRLSPSSSFHTQVANADEMLKGRRKLAGANHGLHSNTEPTPLLRHSLNSIAAIAVAALLAACSGGDAKNGAGGRGGAGGKGPTTVGYVIVQQGSAPIEQELPGPGRGLPGVRGPSASVGRHPSPSVPARAPSSSRARRSTRSIPASIRRSLPRPLANLQSARASAVAARTRASATSRWQTGGRLQAGLHRCGRPGPPGRGRGCAEQCGGAQRADQRPLHPRPRPDQRPHRPVGRDRRGAGHPEPAQFPSDDHPARSGVRRHPDPPRTCSRCARRSQRRRDPDHRASPVEARRRQLLRLQRDRRVQPGAGRSNQPGR